mmetsp:Transcript_21913/g.52143  ORF Transcript_21913/g.52143 Transcript_21913/m.52143 type:complete len:354 (-) Transcript_21913:2877-3938(-)
MSSMDDERFDGLYLNVAQTTRGIEPLLDTVFSFLRRNTDFFAGPPGSEDGPAAAIAKVNQVLEKHADLYKKEKLSKDKKKKEPRQTPKTGGNSKPAAQKKSKPTVTQPFKTTEDDGEDIIEMNNDGGFDVSKSVVSKKPVITPIGKISLDESPKKPSSETKTVATPEKKDDSKSDGEDDNGPPPDGNGGSVPGKYVWTQTLAEVMVNIPVPDNTRGRDVQVAIKRTHLKVSLKSTQAVVVDADLTKPIICDDSFWTIEDGNRLVVNLQKLNQMEWWESVCKGDPIINVRSIRPENSSISDLDGETRKTVEKMMFDQRQKALGLPSSDEQTKLDALEMFKRQHPEMDFSNAKIS